MFKKWKLFYFVMLLGIAFVICGCATTTKNARPFHKRKAVSATPSGAIIYVKKTPPKAIAETPSTRPHASAVWIPGFWKWNGKKYVWAKGYWEINPQGKEWVTGRWEKTRNGWLWKPGYWR